MEDNSLSKKRKIYAYSPADSSLSYTRDAEEFYRIEGLSRYNESKMSSKKNSESVESASRLEYVESVCKALQEFDKLKLLVGYLKGKDILSLQTCVKSVNPPSGQTLSEKVLKCSNGYKQCQNIISKGLQSSRDLVEQRRALCEQSLSLRKKWRLVQSAVPPKAFLTHDLLVCVDCCYSGIGGRTGGLPSGLLPISKDKAKLLQPPSQRYTLRVSLVHVGRGELSAQSLWQLLYGQEKKENVGEMEQGEDFERQCRETAHDRYCRQIMQTLTTQVTSSNKQVFVGCTDSLGSHSSGTFLVSDGSVAGAVLTSFLEESLHDSVFLSCVSRSEVRAALSESLALSVALVPLSSCSSCPSNGLSVGGEFGAGEESIRMEKIFALVASTACLGLDSLLARRQGFQTRQQLLGRREAAGGSWKAISEERKDVAMSNPLAGFLGTVQHRVMMLRLKLFLQSQKRKGNELEAAVIAPAPLHLCSESVVILTSKLTSSRCAMRVTNCSVDLIQREDHLSGGTPGSAATGGEGEEATTAGVSFLVDALPRSVVSYCQQKPSGASRLKFRSFRRLGEYLVGSSARQPSCL